MAWYLCLILATVGPVLLKENAGIFKPGLDVYIVGCVNDLYLAKVLEMFQ